MASLTGYVDEIIAIDGPWKNYSNDLGSTDGTLDILEKYSCKIIEGRWTNEVEKRNAYIKACNTNDWLLVIDSDELLRNGFFLNRLDEYADKSWNVDVFNVNYPDNLYPGKNKTGLLEMLPGQHRLFQKQMYSHYWKRHYYLFRDGYNNGWLEFNRSCPIGIMHIHFLRPQVRKEEKLDYYMYRLHNKTEGRGHYSYWLFDECWRHCLAFKDQPGNRAIDYDCVCYKHDRCNAHPGNVDLRGNKHIGPLILL